MYLPKSIEKKIINAKGRLDAQEVAKEGKGMSEVSTQRIKGKKKGEKIVKIYPILGLVLGIVLPILSYFILGFPLNYIPTIPLGFIGLVLGFFPIIRILDKSKTRQKKLEKQFSDILRKTATDLAGGIFSLTEALKRSIDESPQPIKMELKQVYNEIEVGGAKFNEAIMGIDRRNDSQVIKRVCNTLANSYEQLEEKEMGYALSNTSEMIQQDESLEKQKQNAFTKPVMNLILIIIIFVPILTTIVSKFMEQMLPFVEQMGQMGSQMAETGGMGGIGGMEEGASVEEIKDSISILTEFAFSQGTISLLGIALLIKKDFFWFIKWYGIFSIILIVIGVI
ncbi:MAG: type II secretion system F family protein [Candidatus Woesearchaeota archaeon]